MASQNVFKLSVLTFILFAIGITVAEKEAFTCLYCKHADTQSGFLYNYNFCDFNNTCTEDAWLKQNDYCYDGWKQGYAMGLK